MYTYISLVLHGRRCCRIVKEALGTTVYGITLIPDAVPGAAAATVN